MTKKLRADIILILITVMWGASFPLIKMVLAYMPAIAYMALRFLLAAAVLFLIFLKDLKKLNSKTVLYGLIVGIFMFAGSILQVFGLYTTSASNSGFITGMNVVIVPVISAIMLKKRPDRSSVFGVLVAFIGLFFLSGGLNFNFNIGDLLTFICSICWAFQIIFVDKFTSEVQPTLLAGFSMLFTGIASGVIWLAGTPEAVVLNRTSVSILLFTAIFSSAIAYGGQAIAQKDTTPTHAALIFTAEPVFAAIFAMIIPDIHGQTERLGLFTAIGCILILGGMLVSEFKIGKDRPEVTGTSEIKKSALY